MMFDGSEFYLLLHSIHLHLTYIKYKPYPKMDVNQQQLGLSL